MLRWLVAVRVAVQANVHWPVLQQGFLDEDLSLITCKQQGFVGDHSALHGETNAKVDAQRE